MSSVNSSLPSMVVYHRWSLSIKGCCQHRKSKPLTLPRSGKFKWGLLLFLSLFLSLLSQAKVKSIPSPRLMTGVRQKQTGSELCQGQLKLELGLFYFRLKDNSINYLMIPNQLHDYLHTYQHNQSAYPPTCLPS